jgi:F-type H+-transporting ATPase subunit a
MFFFSPLEQFDSIYFFSKKFDFLNIFFILIFIVLIFIYIYLYLNFKLIPTVLQWFFELFYKFLLETLVQQAGTHSLFFFPFIFTIFFFILFSNIFGMLPFSFTITGHLSLTFFLAFGFNLGFFFLGFFKNGLKFLKLFVPSGTPVFLLPLIIVIEVVSYLIRTLSLSIRLFANMMAGHCLLYVISSFVFSFLNNLGIISLIFIIFVYLAIFILEFAIAFLQSYVFTILLSIYLNDALHPAH